MYFVRSVAHLVKISSIVLFLSRDCDGGAGPEVEAAAARLAGGAASFVMPGKMKPGAAVVAAEVVAAVVEAVAFGAPKLKPEVDVVGAAEVAVGAAAPNIFGASAELVVDALGAATEDEEKAKAGFGAVPVDEVADGVEDGPKLSAGFGAVSDGVEPADGLVNEKPPAVALAGLFAVLPNRLGTVV